MILGHDGRLAFGEFDNKVSARAQAFLDACKAGNIVADIPPDISLELWQKFVVIVTMSSITSAMRSTIGPIRANPHARQFALDLMREVVAVGRAKGIALDPDFAEKRIAHVDGMAPEMRASMALDLELGRPLNCRACRRRGRSRRGRACRRCCRAVRDILGLWMGSRASGCRLSPRKGIPVSFDFAYAGMSGKIQVPTPASAARASARASATCSSLHSASARSTLSVPMHLPLLTSGTFTQECSPRPKMIA